MLIASKSKLWIVFCGDVVIIGFIKGDERSMLYSHNIKIHNTYVWLLMKYIISSNVLGEIITSLFLDPPAFYDLLHILLPLNVWKRQKRKRMRKRKKITKRPIYDSSRSIYVCIKCRRHSMVNTRVCVPSSLSGHLKSRRVNVCIWHVFTTEESLNQSKLRKYFFFQKRERFFDASN